MTTTTTFQGMEPGAKNSSRVLRPPGGASNISFGTDDDKTPVRKNKMASNIFAEPDDPHAHRRNNPPGGQPTGILCGEPSAPLRRCPQPLLFPKSDGLEQTSICNSAAKVEVHEQPNDAADSPEDGEADQEQRGEEPPQPAAPSGAAAAAGTGAATGRRNPPGGKSSLILG